MLECNRCHKDVVKDNVVLHRMNPIGEVPVIWWCEDCCNKNGVGIDTVIEDITGLIKESNKRRGKNIKKIR